MVRRRYQMKALAVAVPLAHEMIDEGRRVGEEVAGPRRAEHTQSRRELGITKELGWVQTTPQGELFILYLEGEDPVKANAEFAASTTPYNTWFKERVGPVFAPTGVDFSQPIPPIIEQVYDWEAPQRPSGEYQMFAAVFPILPGKTEAARSAYDTMRERQDEHRASRERLGMYKEQVWIEHTPQGDLEVGYFEAQDVGRVFELMGASQEPYDVWFRQFVMDTSGIDLTAPLPGPPPELVLNWQDSQTK
jgi:hypothetical protein